MRVFILLFIFLPLSFFSQKKRLLPFADEVYVSINQNNSFSHAPRLGFGLGFGYNLMDKPHFNLSLGLDYFNSSVYVDFLNMSKRGSDTYRNATFTFNSLSVPLIFRHEIGNKFALTINYGLNVGVILNGISGQYIYSEFTSPNYELTELDKETELLIQPGIHFGLGFKFPVGNNFVIINPNIRRYFPYKEEFNGGNMVSSSHIALAVRFMRNE